MNDRRRILRYLAGDYLGAVIAWLCFSIFRFYVTRDTIDFPDLGHFLFFRKSLMMTFGVPILWLIISFLCGYYSEPRRKNHLNDFLRTLVITLLGSMILFFTVVINDYPSHYTLFYSVFGGLFLFHLTALYLGRSILTRRYLRKHARGEAGIRALIVGQGASAREIYDYLKHRNQSPYIAMGHLNYGGRESLLPEKDCFGDFSRLKVLLDELQIECLILALEPDDCPDFQALTGSLLPYDLEILCPLRHDVFPWMDVTLDSPTGLPLARLTPRSMSAAQRIAKRIFDLLVSSLGLILLTPLWLFILIRSKIKEPDCPVFYRQERLGKGRKPFKIIKFRTMVPDAEANGPQLSSTHDERITPYGHHLRKYRLDELPQLVNVLKGEMSLVGPRPERACYARQILEKEPAYHFVYRVQPGVTSLGMVKYGYADSVDKMLERFNYDLIYLKNPSLLMDLRILFYTFRPLLKGEGV